jgi:hypothetical protein
MCGQPGATGRRLASTQQLRAAGPVAAPEQTAAGLKQAWDAVRDRGNSFRIADLDFQVPLPGQVVEMSVFDVNKAVEKTANHAARAAFEQMSVSRRSGAIGLTQP